MNSKDRKIIYISVIVSLLLHVLGLILLNFDDLFGSAIAEKTEQPKPIELVFEQPQQQADQIPDKFYELVENPNASGDKPQNSDRLSTESSLNQAPKIQPGEIRAVPGSEEAKSKKSAPQETQSETRIEDAARGALLAYQPSKVFSRSALTGKKKRSEEQEDSENEKGETQTDPNGFNADLVGDYALSTYAWEWAPYWLEFKRKLNRLWIPPAAYSRLGLIHGYTIFRFKVSRSGEMYDLKVLKHVGHPSLEQSSESALKSAFPFKPLPDDFPDEYLEVNLKMIYPDLRALYGQ